MRSPSRSRKGSSARGIEVRARRDGQRGDRGGREFDVVLLDLRLPDVDGYTVCRELRSRSDVPIIILSARGEEVDRIVGLELGADDYLVKPFGFRELLARIRAVTRRAGSRTSRHRLRRRRGASRSTPHAARARGRSRARP